MSSHSRYHPPMPYTLSPVSPDDSVTLADVRAYLNKYPIDRTTIVSFGPLRSIEGIAGKTV